MQRCRGEPVTPQVAALPDARVHTKAVHESSAINPAAGITCRIGADQQAWLILSGLACPGIEGRRGVCRHEVIRVHPQALERSPHPAADPDTHGRVG